MSRTEEKLDNEIEQLAEKMVKSQADAKQLLFDTIMELGPEGLKKAKETLPPEQQELLKSCIEDFAKAATKPQPVAEDKAAKVTETPANAMKTESLSGSDDEDEKKLMNDKNANHAHQGGPADKPEGWQGEVVKAQKSEDEEPEVEMPAKDAVKEHKRLVNVLESESHEDDKKEAKKQKKELSEYKQEMKKAESPAVKKLIEMEEAEHGQDINGDGKIAEKLKKDEKEPKMKKALEEIVALAKSLKMTKEEVVKAVKDAGNDLELVKADMEKKKKLLAEEDQSKTKMQDESTAEKIDESKGDLEIKSQQTADEVKAPMAKSVVWAPKNTLAANTLGRNAHYDVVEAIEKSEADKQETIKKGGYFGETQGEPLKKSEGEKTDINDLIEKGMDYSTDEIKRIEGVRDHKVEGRLVKSFYDKDIAAALGLSEEEAKKLLGE